MNHCVDAFLKEVLGQVKYKKMHPYLAQELNDHIECIKEDLMEEGFSEEEAYKKAVAHMGAPDEIGEGLHKLHKPRMEWSVLLLLLGLVGIGLGTMIAYGEVSGEIYYYSKQMIWILCGLMMLLQIRCFVSYKVLEKYSSLFYLIGIGFLLATYHYGIQVNGVRRWIAIGGVAVQGPVLATPPFIIAYTGYVKKWINKGALGQALLALLTVVPTLICVRMQIVQGICLFITLGAIFIFYLMSDSFKGNRKKVWAWILAFSGMMMGTLIAAIVMVPYRLERIKAWFNPALAPNDEGYFINKIRNICSNASLFGKGEFTDAEEFIIQQYGMTDYTYNFILAYMGKATAFIVALVVGCFIIRCFKSAYKVSDQYGRTLMLGISSLLAIRFIFSMGLSLGVLPFHCTMPLISYSGSAFLCDMAMMGLLLGVYRRKDICPAKLVQKETLCYETISLLSELKRYFLVEDDEEEDFELELKIDKDYALQKSDRELAEMALDILKNSNEVEHVEVKFKENV
ncbi:MAG: FtsW/RodA/SpoVE family cell cycle protein [Cellulosilyticum sp.]|nr:FtsW/RodA/SpoVE family cell cycle protein [Cellulosilyticum sp.]